MKNTWMAVAISAAMIQPVFADGGPGCGLGSTLFKGKSGVVPHVLAATTNGTSGNQTFGMTTGTLGCNASSPITLAASLFVDQNMEQLAKDMSRGQGEHLDALATILKIKAEDRPAFSAAVQANFQRIFDGADTAAGTVIDNLAAVMEQDASLKKYLG